MAVGGFYPDHRAQKFRIGGNEGWRHVALLHQRVLAIDIGHHRFEQIGALDEAFGDDLPFGIVDQNRDMGDRPVAFAAATADALSAIIAIEDAGIAQIAVGTREAVVQLTLVHARKSIDEGLPDGADAPVYIQHFIGNARQRAIAQHGSHAGFSGLAFRCRCLRHLILLAGVADRVSAEIPATPLPARRYIDRPCGPMARIAPGDALPPRFH